MTSECLPHQVRALQEKIDKLHFERRKDAVVMRMAPRLQSSAEKLRQHLLGRSRGRARARLGAHGGSSTASGGSGAHASASATTAAEQLQLLDAELQVRAGLGLRRMVCRAADGLIATECD
jgi:hypothetical protein